MAAAMKHIVSSFAKLEKFKRVDFRRLQKKMHFMLSSMSLVYVLTTPMPEDGGENPTVEQVRKRAKWDNNDYVCRGLILNAKYMAEDASSKNFLVSNFTNYKMIDSRPVLEQYNELLRILGRFTQHKMNMDKSIQDSDKPEGNNVACPLVVNMVEHNNSSRYNDNKGKRKHHDTRANPNKKPKITCWKYGKPGHLKRIPRLVMLAKQPMDQAQKDQRMWVDSGATVHVCKDRCWFKTYESLNDGSILHMGNESTALVHRCGCVDLSLHVNLNDSILWHARLGHVHFKRMKYMSKNRLISAIDMDTEKWNKKYFVIFIDDASRAVVSLLDPKLKSLGERGIECIFVGYDEHSKAFSQRSLVKGTENSGGLVVSEIVTDEIVQQSESQLRKSKRHKTPKDFGPEFQLYLIEGTRDEKEAINDEMDSIIGNNTWVLTDLPLDGCEESFLEWGARRGLYEPTSGFIMPGNENKVCKLIKSLYGLKHTPKQWHQKFDEVVLSNGYLLNQANKCGSDQEFLSSRFSMKDMREANVILGIRIKHESNDTCEKLMPNRGMAISQLKYSRVIGCLMYAMTCSKPEFTFAVKKLGRYTSNPKTQHWQAIQRVLKYLKKTMDYRLVYSGKEAKWLKNLLFEIPL
uniref:Retrovirus-related Pol polyprotein from transposon TNT 1-94-like beta-barrel domain-containing protein n=1 Tax=Tanacetum cinerariifolium TaxID=118510 RepID=A0A6L2LIU9_TANCI|nr:hypothetical protein [Tanacetum cinerariifolium]